MDHSIFVGKPHHDYSNHKYRNKLIEVIHQISQGFPSIYKISRTTNIPESTLRNWKKQLMLDPEWRPWKNRHGYGHRIFTDAEEAAIKDYIFKNFLEPGFVFTNQDFIDIAVNAYLTKHNDDLDNDKIVKDFLVSHQFIYDFKERNHISSRAIHYKRRPSVSQEEKNKWVQLIKELLNNNAHDRIVNCDETSWKACPNGILTWAEKGTDGIKIEVNSNEKECITAMASIKADGTKIPLFILAHGKTPRCETSQIGDISHHMSTYSENGWMTNDTFYQYLLFLRQHFGDEEVIHLILDTYTANVGEQIKNLAETLNIKLYYIPPGLTDEFQPLDRRVFGCLKATARSLFRKDYNYSRLTKFTKKVSVSYLIYAWEHLTADVILESWDIYSQ